MKKFLPRIVSFVLAGVLMCSMSVAERENKGLIQAAAIRPSNPIVEKEKGTTTWNCIYFGNYWQSDTNKDSKSDKNDDKEKIKWRVLSVNSDTALLLADQNLDAVVFKEFYDDATWETSDVRKWLNNTFYYDAFSESEQKAIKTITVVNNGQESIGVQLWVGYDSSVSCGNDTSDKVYLLSESEVVNAQYGFVVSGDDLYSATNTRVSSNTAFTASGGSKGYTMSNANVADGWWLRTMGFAQYLPASVSSTGALMYGYYNNDYSHVAVRPVIQIDLSDSSLWSNAEDVVEKHSYEEKTVSKDSENTGNNTDSKDSASSSSDASGNSSSSISSNGSSSGSSNNSSNSSSSSSKNSSDTMADTESKGASNSVSGSTTAASLKKPSKTKLALRQTRKKKIFCAWYSVSCTGYQIQLAKNKSFTTGKKIKTTKKIYCTWKVKKEPIM